MQGIGNVTVHGCRFVNNSGTGLLIENSGVYFSASYLFQGNKAYNGGGMALYWDSSLELLDNATMFFQDNFAENVG